MKTKERLERSGWQFLLYFGNMTVMKRSDKRVLLDERTGEIRLVYGDVSGKYQPHTPNEDEIDFLCEPENKVNSLSFLE